MPDPLLPFLQNRLIPPHLQSLADTAAQPMLMPAPQTSQPTPPLAFLEPALNRGTEFLLGAFGIGPETRANLAGQMVGMAAPIKTLKQLGAVAKKAKAGRRLKATTPEGSVQPLFGNLRHENLPAGEVPHYQEGVAYTDPKGSPRLRLHEEAHHAWQQLPVEIQADVEAAVKRIPEDTLSELTGRPRELGGEEQWAEFWADYRSGKTTRDIMQWNPATGTLSMQPYQWPQELIDIADNLKARAELGAFQSAKK